MSKVYSFRLSDDNPREAQASEVINNWVSRGYSLRHLLTEALLICLEKENRDDEVYNLLEQIKLMISELEKNPSFELTNEHELQDLSSSFMFAVKNSAKSGVRVK